MIDTNRTFGIRDNKSMENVSFSFIPLYHMRPDDRSSEGYVLKKEWEESSDFFPVCDMFIESIVGGRKDQLFSIAIQCDSMSPEIIPGSMVIADKEKTKPATDGIFIVMFDDFIRMKLVQMLPGKRLQLSTINNRYQPVELEKEELNKIDILGRVIWIGKPA